MLRPAISSGEYGRTPFTCSTVVSMVNSGTISTMPPTAMTITVSTSSRNSVLFDDRVGELGHGALLPGHGKAARQWRLAPLPRNASSVDGLRTVWIKL